MTVCAPLAKKVARCAEADYIDFEVLIELVDDGIYYAVG